MHYIRLFRFMRWIVWFIRDVHAHDGPVYFSKSYIRVGLFNNHLAAERNL